MLRRNLVGLGAGALAAGLVGRQTVAQEQRAAAAPLVLVLNSGEATISRVDFGLRREIDRLPALREPHHVIQGPGDAGLIIGDSGGNEFLFVDPATGALRRRLRVSNPYHLALAGDGSSLVVLSLRRDQIDLYDPSDMRLLRRFAMPVKPSHPAYAPDGRTVFATLQGTGEVVAIDVATQEVRWRSVVGPEPAGIAWAPAGMLVVGIMGGDHVAVVNPDDGRVERQIVTGRGAHAVFPTPDGRNLVVTNRVAGTISLLDGTTLAELRRYVTPGGPDCIAFSPDGRELWYTRRWAQSVGVLALETGAILATIRVGRSPHGIFVSAPA
jgi:DNA-binding beta-propeller fold protein YncE